LDYPVGTQFVYSDLSAVLLGFVVERISNLTLNEYVEKNIFMPLEMRTSMFNPPKSYYRRCAPAVNDTIWRHKLVKGFVHDPTAYILGGVSGNAGLFSTASDL